MKTSAFCLVALWILIFSSNAMAAQFHELGFTPGRTNSSTATDVSDDGSVVVGYSRGSGISDSEAFRWTLSGGMAGLGDLSGGVFYSQANGVSADGSIVVGQAMSASGGQGFRWTSIGGMAALGTMPGGTYSIANGISANGSLVVGVGDSTSGYQAFRWTTTGGAVGLGVLSGGTSSTAQGASSDGLVIVGQADIQAFRWTSGGGMVGLGYLSGGSESTAFSTSADGSVAVGYSNTTTGYEAIRWTSTGGMVGLGLLPGGTTSFATSVSADGSVVVGSADATSGSTCFLWNSTSGMRELKSALLSDYGLDLSGWTIYSANAVSANGRAICGNGISPSGVSQAWMVLLDPLQLNWRNTSSGNWDTTGNWDFAHPATYMTDVSINPSIGMNVTGPAGAATIKSLTIGTSTSGVATLNVQESGPMNVNGATTIGGSGRITGNGTFNAIGGMYNNGEIDLGYDGLQLVGGILTNNGVIRGKGYIANNLQNNSTGEVRLSGGDRLVFSGAATNAGKIEVLGSDITNAEIEFKQGLNNQSAAGAIFARNATLRFGGTGLTNASSVGISFGTSDIFGKISNTTTGKIVLSGNSNTTFYDDIVNNGSLKVSQGSTAVFFGDLQGAGPAGTGTVFIEGDLRPGVYGASLQLAGSPSLSSDGHHVNILNDSSTGLIVSGTNYVVGSIEGSGNTTVYGGGSLTTGSLSQNTLTILAGGIVTIAPIPGGLLSGMDSLHSVPEPSTLVLLSIATTLIVYSRRRRNNAA